MINIGDLLRAFGIITREQLDAAVAEQKKAPERRLGEILVEMKAASKKQVADCLHKQDKLRSSSVVDSKDAAAIADYAAHTVLEGAEGKLQNITGIYDVSDFKSKG